MIRRLVFLSLYRIIIAPIGVLSALTLGTLFIPKVRKGIRLRLKKRDWPEFDRPPLWIHASSGEFEYAKPLIRELKRLDPKQPIAVTYFSPSFASAVHRFPGVDFALPLPVDLPGPCRSFLRKLKPKAGLIARTDLWPELLQQAANLHIPMFLFSATKTKSPALLIRPFDRWIYGYLKMIFCVDTDDSKCFAELATGIPCFAIGDTRFDQVLERLRSPKKLRDELKPDRERTLVAGSTWGEDEKVLIKALTEPLRTGSLRLIIVPHEPTPSHIEALQLQCKGRGLNTELYSKSTHFDANILIIDQIGILAELYQWGSIAFVGGSFKGAVHSVMEPLAAGCLTLVGPYHRNNREALDFQKLQLNGIAPVEVAKDAASFRRLVETALPQLDDKFSKALRLEIEKRGGASRRLIDQLSLPFQV